METGQVVQEYEGREGGRKKGRKKGKKVEEVKEVQGYGKLGSLSRARSKGRKERRYWRAKTDM